MSKWNNNHLIDLNLNILLYNVSWTDKFLLFVPSQSTSTFTRISRQIRTPGWTYVFGFSKDPNSAFFSIFFTSVCECNFLEVLKHPLRFGRCSTTALKLQNAVWEKYWFDFARQQQKVGVKIFFPTLGIKLIKGKFLRCMKINYYRTKKTSTVRKNERESGNLKKLLKGQTWYILIISYVTNFGFIFQQ